MNSGAALLCAHVLICANMVYYIFYIHKNDAIFSTKVKEAFAYLTWILEEIRTLAYFSFV